MGLLNKHIVKQKWFHGVPSVFAATAERADFSTKGALVAVTGTVPWVAETSYTILGTICAVGTAPTGANLILDVKKNGVTIYTTTANRPTITAGTKVSATSWPTPNVTSLVAGDVLTLDVAQIGSTVAGSDLQAAVVLQRIV